jgi:hypothetical protein
MNEEETRDMRKLLHRIGAMEKELSVVGRAVGLQNEQPGNPDAAPVNRDARWHCKKCGYLLGFYDVGADLLRTRYKEHIVYVRCGDGGFVQVVCRGCSEVNTAEGESAVTGGSGTPDDSAG